MSSWFAQNLGDGMLAMAPLQRIEERVLSLDESVRGQAELAVFVRHESEGHLHCEVTVYFSPAAAEVAQAFDARPCQRPSPGGLSLLAGAEAAWPALFPERFE